MRNDPRPDHWPGARRRARYADGRRRQRAADCCAAKPLAAHVLTRLAPQTGALLISANRHPEAYAALGAPFGATVVADTLPGFPGPLAGLLAGLRAAGTAFVLSAPCDSPGLPADLATRLPMHWTRLRPTSRP